MQHLAEAQEERYTPASFSGVITLMILSKNVSKDVGKVLGWVVVEKASVKTNGVFFGSRQYFAGAEERH